jgi:hypothetical protein
VKCDERNLKKKTLGYDKRISRKVTGMIDNLMQENRRTIKMGMANKDK